MNDINRGPINAARHYENLLVPALFRQWPTRILDAVGVKPGDSVLDVACGTGVLTRRARQRVGRGSDVVGLDCGLGMLQVASEQMPGIDWRLGAAEALPFVDESLDVVVSQFGLMFFSDRQRALEEMVRVLAPGGRFAVAVWGSLQANTAYADEVSLLDTHLGRRAGDAVRLPYCLGDKDVLNELFLGISDRTAYAIRTHRDVAEFPAIRSMVEADLRGWLPIMGVTPSEREIQSFVRESEHAMRRYALPDGRMRFPISAHIVAGRKNHD